MNPDHSRVRAPCLWRIRLYELYLSFVSPSYLSNLVVALNNAIEQWSYSNCVGSYFNCNGIKAGALTNAKMINEAVKVGYCYCRLFIAPRWR